MPVCLAGSNRESPGEDGARNRDNDEISDREIACSADNSSARIAHRNLAPTYGLLELRQLLDRFHYAHDEVADDALAQSFDCLDFETGSNQPFGNSAA
jgi:hypothetical protein